MDLKERIELARTTMNALEQIEANKGKVPDGFILEFRADWSKGWIESCHTIATDIATVDNSGFYRLRSTTPCQVPLGPEDIPPFSVVRHPDWMESYCWAFVTCVYASSQSIYINASSRVSRTFDQLMSEGWLIKRQSDTEWQPCSKDASN